MWTLNGHTPVITEDRIAWRALIMNVKARRVAFDVVGESRVSTVFIALDHSFLGDGPPILFETMVFNGKEGELESRYATWEEAEAGHKQVVEHIRATQKEESDKD